MLNAIPFGNGKGVGDKILPIFKTVRYEKYIFEFPICKKQNLVKNGRNVGKNGAKIWSKIAKI